MGLVPQSLAKAASDRTQSVLSPKHDEHFGGGVGADAEGEVCLSWCGAGPD